MSDAPVIHWFRRDLRLTDNLALRAALETGAPVIALFIFDPVILGAEKFGVPRLAFMLDGLRALDAELREYGTRLLIRRGDPLRELPTLVNETGASAIFFNRDYTPYAVKRDAAMAAVLSVQMHGHDDQLLHAPDALAKDNGDPYTVFTPFRKRWLNLPKPAIASGVIEGRRFHDLTDIDTPEVPSLADLGFGETLSTPPAGEKEARRRLQAFIDASLDRYADVRNDLTLNPFDADAAPSTSGLSPYLRMGMLSPRQAYHLAAAAHNDGGDGARHHSINTWISELCWREFYQHILYHFPYAYRTSYRPEFERVEFRDAPDDLQRWADGMTGYPIVDAAQRQMNTIGWMHNRARMITASFLTKHLLFHFSAGEILFMQRLMDGDPAANNGGWQWAAGTGTDAQPYFRIFNPMTQGEKFDPDGAYVRRYVPELRDVPNEFIHAPWEMPTPPPDYPAPIVDHKAARERALAAFKAIRPDTRPDQQEPEMETR